MKSTSNAIQELLIRTRRRLNCFAVAFVSRRYGLFDIDCADDQRGEYAEQLLRQSVDSFFAMCADQRDPIVRNRVRAQKDGPLLCRFLLVPVYDDLDTHAGIFVMYNPATGVAFNATDANMASGLAPLFSQAISPPRDPLTKLVTREGFERLIALHRESHPDQAHHAVIYGDIDQLHVINDLLGFQAGDRAIVVVSEQLQRVAVEHHGTVSRLSGDRFTVFIPDCSLDRASNIAEQMRTAVAKAHFTSNTQPIQLTVSCGVAPLSTDDTNVGHGLAAAELACKAAKDRGRNRVELYQDTDASIIGRHNDLLIVGKIRSAIEEGRIEVFGQAIAHLQRGEQTRRYEMLVRLIDENDKLVMPQVFISSATRYQLLPQLDRHVVSHVLKKMALRVTEWVTFGHYLIRWPAARKSGF